MANLDSELEHNQFKHHILARWIKNNKNKFNTLFPINKPFSKTMTKEKSRHWIPTYAPFSIFSTNMYIEEFSVWYKIKACMCTSLNIKREVWSMLVLLRTINIWVENCRNNPSFFLEAPIFQKTMSKISSFVSVDFGPWCRAMMINQSPERKQSFSTTTFSYLPEMWYHADLLTASPGDHD